MKDGRIVAMKVQHKDVQAHSLIDTATLEVSFSVIFLTDFSMTYDSVIFLTDFSMTYDSVIFLTNFSDISHKNHESCYFLFRQESIPKF